MEEMDRVNVDIFLKTYTYIVGVKHRLNLEWTKNINRIIQLQGILSN